jgi:fructose-bisphosphate aldolase class II
MLVNIRDILAPAKKHCFAVPAFNVSTNMLLRAVMEECVKNNSPLIISMLPVEISFTLNSFAAMVIAEANRVPIPVCLHLDHGTSYAQIVNAIRNGFTSVMIDSSTSSFVDNVLITQRIVETAHCAGVTVEAELGTIGSADSNNESGTEKLAYTNPDDVGIFVHETNIDALAVAIGTAHGLYPKEKRPKLRIDLLEEIAKCTCIPLVLHGGSDNPDSEIKQAVQKGICKINISSDIKTAFYQKCREVLADMTLREPNAIYLPCIEATKQVVLSKLNLFNSVNAARYY